MPSPGHIIMPSFGYIMMLSLGYIVPPFLGHIMVPSIWSFKAATVCRSHSGRPGPGGDTAAEQGQEPGDLHPCAAVGGHGEEHQQRSQEVPAGACLFLC